MFATRVLLCHVDVTDSEQILREVTRTCFLHSWTLICVWSLEEAGRYLETFKMYEKKQADMIKEKKDEQDKTSDLHMFLTTIRRINKSDVVTLSKSFESVAAMAEATQEQLAACPGLGPKKVRRLLSAFSQPFVKP